MPRPQKCRRIGFAPEVTRFKPAGIPGRGLREVSLALDELEAVRLVDWVGLYQEEAAARMGVSRQTLGNILVSAHRKLADCLVNGRMLRIEGGRAEMVGERAFQCDGCGREWSLPFGTGRPAQCPACGHREIHRSMPDRGCGGCRRRTGF